MLLGDNVIVYPGHGKGLNVEKIFHQRLAQLLENKKD